jgi:hypothetical protein
MKRSADWALCVNRPKRALSLSNSCALSPSKGTHPASTCLHEVLQALPGLRGLFGIVVAERP